MIVMTLISLIAAVAFPAVAAGLDSLRLRAASDSIVGFLNKALDRADRRQRVVEVWISPMSNGLSAVASDASYTDHIDVPEPVHIISVLPAERFLLYPGGAPPRIAIEIGNQQGRRRLISVDPITGFPHAEAIAP